jgi:arylsulfatase A-like enzyme
VDLLPTLLELTGSAVPADALPGASLADALRGDAPLDPERPVYLQREAFTADRVGEFPVAGEKLGLRVGVWKYLEAPEEGTRELFHLERDPAERRNLADAEPERVAGLARRLAPHREALRRVAEPPALEASDRRRLEALGYTE